jgi:hypothetical protein
MRRFLWAGVLLWAGCSGPAGTPLTLDQLPPGHLQKAQEKLPTVKFESASKKADGTYEIRGKDAKGKSWEVEIAPNGTVTLD